MFGLVIPPAPAPYPKPILHRSPKRSNKTVSRRTFVHDLPWKQPALFERPFSDPAGTRRILSCQKTGYSQVDRLDFIAMLL